MVKKKGDGVSRVTLETNEQILHQININLVLLEVSDCRVTQTLSVTSTTKTSMTLCLTYNCLHCWIWSAWFTS
jgi:hypothetical protein